MLLGHPLMRLLRSMSAIMLFLVVLLAGLVFATNGNSTASPDVSNISRTTTSPVSLTLSTFLPTNTTHKTSSTLGIKKNDCFGFEVFVVNNPLNIPYTVTCCVAVLCGFYLVLFGYRFFKFSLFLLGFMFATFLTFIICSNHAELPAWGLISVSLAVGIFCGLLTMFVIYCGLFLGGFGLGFFIGLAIFFIIETFLHVSIKWIPFGVLLGLSVIFGLLALRWQKGLFIVATCLIGGALITGGVDYFIEEFVLLNYAWQRIMAGDGGMKCWVTWVIVAIWPVMFILGIVVQFCKTGRTFTHRKRTDSLSLQGEDKAMKRYRSLNMNGDVVAKSYYSKEEEEGRPTEV